MQSLQLGYGEKCLVAAKATMNASCLSEEGNHVKLMNCGIQTERITTLSEYMKHENPTKLKNWNPEINEDKNLARVFVIPVTLPNGQEMDVLVNQKGQDMACIYQDEAGNEKRFSLTPRMKAEIERATPDAIRKFVGEAVYQKEFLPKSIEEFAEKVSDDTLVPKNKEDAMSRVGVKSKEELEESKNRKEREEQEIEKEIPEEARDIIAEICSKNNDCDIADLKQVIAVKNASSITDKVRNTEFSDNGERIYCLRFRGKEVGGNDRIIMVQGDKYVDERKYDADVTELMNDKHQKVVDNMKDKDSKITYTDLDGHTFVADLEREPRDLTMEQKDDILQEMYNLDKWSNQILSEDTPLAEKTEKFIRVNEARVSLLGKYGVKVPTIKGEIQEDIEISEEKLQKDVEGDDGRDPREANHDPFEGKHF